MPSSRIAGCHDQFCVLCVVELPLFPVSGPPLFLAVSAMLRAPVLPLGPTSTWYSHCRGCDGTSPCGMIAFS